MSNKSWSNLPSRGGNGCQGTENPKWHFGICYSTFNRLRTLTCHPSSGAASEVKGEHHGAIGHCLCLPRCGLRATGANQHPAKRSVIGPVYSVIAWLHAWLACCVPLDEHGVRRRGLSACARCRGRPCAKFLSFALSPGCRTEIKIFVIEFLGFFLYISYHSSLQYFYTEGETFLSLTVPLLHRSSPSFARAAEKLSSAASVSPWKRIWIYTAAAAAETSPAKYSEFQAHICRWCGVLRSVPSTSFTEHLALCATVCKT